MKREWVVAIVVIVIGIAIGFGVSQSGVLLAPGGNFGAKNTGFGTPSCSEALDGLSDGSASARDINNVRTACSGLSAFEADRYAQSQGVTSGVCEEPRADVNRDEIVDFADILVILGNWGCTDCLDEDVNQNGVVDFADILIILGNWGCEVSDPGGFIEVCDGTGGTITLDEVRNDLTENYRQTCDITLSGSFAPLGDFSGPFVGTYEGDGFTISNFEYVNPSSSNPVGLFGTVWNTGKVMNVNLVNANVEGRENTGSLVGHCFNGAIISGSSTTGGTVVGNDGNPSGRFTGGLVGHMHPLCTLSNSFSQDMSVTGGSRVGGLVGNHHGSIIENSYALNPTVRFDGRGGGGLVGWVQNARNVFPDDYNPTIIRDSYAENVDVEQTTLEGFYAGGLVGFVDHEVFIENSYVDGGTVKNDGPDSKYVGGLIGRAVSNTEITGSHSNNVVALSGFRYCGGLVGATGSDGRDFEDPIYVQGPVKISNSYSIGFSCTGDAYLSGILGAANTDTDAYPEVFITDSYAEDASIISVTYAGGLVGRVSLPISGFDVHVNRSYFSGRVQSVVEQNAGGILGVTDAAGSGDGKVIIDNSYAEGDVVATGSAGAGGLVGASTSSTIVRNSYFNGDISALNKAGGISASSFSRPNFVNVYSSFRYFGDGYGVVGGAVGNVLGGSGDGPVIANAFWDLELSGVTDICGRVFIEGFECTGAEGVSTEAMRMQSTYEPEWDFESVWAIDEGVSYPYLQWEV